VVGGRQRRAEYDQGLRGGGAAPSNGGNLHAPVSMVAVPGHLVVIFLPAPVSIFPAHGAQKLLLAPSSTLRTQANEVSTGCATVYSECTTIITLCKVAKPHAFCLSTPTYRSCFAVTIHNSPPVYRQPSTPQVIVMYARIPCG
jgi:hypothetical protein